MTTRFYYVYLIRSINSPAQTYVGFTEDLEQRFMADDTSPRLAAQMVSSVVPRMVGVAVDQVVGP